MQTENPIKSKICTLCKQVTYFNPSMPYQTKEDRNPTKCAYCGAQFKASKCDKCSKPTHKPTKILNGSVTLCEDCAKPIGSSCKQKGVPYETWIGSSGLCGACVETCEWVQPKEVHA